MKIAKWLQWIVLIMIVIRIISILTFIKRFTHIRVFALIMPIYLRHFVGVEIFLA